LGRGWGFVPELWYGAGGRGVSVDPGDGDPLRRTVNPLDGSLEGRYGFVNVVVHYGQVEEVTVRLPQQFGLLRQPLEAPIILKRKLSLVLQPKLHAFRSLNFLHSSVICLR
jgi:hypothetical protein